MSGATRRSGGRGQPGTARLTFQTHHHDAVVILDLCGRAGAGDPAAVRAALLHCLAECPAAVVLDLSELQVTDDEPLLAIPAALRDARTWPPVPVLLATADPELVGRLDRLRINQQTRRFAGVDEALAAARSLAGRGDRVAATLPATPQAPAQARALLNRACRGWDLAGLAPSAEVIVSELCANAVVHARTSMRLLVLRTPTHLYLVVRDEDHRLPRQRQPPADGTPAAGGNGLHLVAAFATAWGTMPTADGKAVWASVRLPGRPV